ncbi:MAG: YcxB family protein [Oscillospiraceae bacterium]|nr:YcxB family protein [Oscillospiraceae bacterium]
MAFDDIYDDGRVSLDEKIAEGEYESSSEDILSGFKVFQKRYVYKGVVLQMALVILGLLSQVVNIMGAAQGEDLFFSYMLIVVCIILGVYILTRPKGTYKRLSAAIKELDGTVYRSEFYTNKIIISTIYDPYNKDDPENFDNVSENESDNGKEKNDGQSEKDESSDDLPPATVIHLDNGSVEIVETDKLYVVYIKRVNVFVIPKSAFKAYEVTQIKDKLSNIMGVRFKEK